MRSGSVLRASVTLSLADVAAMAEADLPVGADPEAARPSSSFAEGGISPHALVHPTAQIADGVMVDPGAIVGPGARIGAGSRIGAYSVVGADVRIGRDCALA